MNLENNNQTNRGSEKGRPRINNVSSSNSQIEPTNSNQQQFWFQSKEATDIIIILAKKCQIIFKCLSGRYSQKYQDKKFWSDIKKELTFKKFKKERNAFARTAKNLQNQLLKKLEQHLQIKLIGEQDKMNFFFFGRNNVTKQTQNSIMDLLNPYIHQDFKDTLTEVLELTNQPKPSKLDMSRKNDLYNINKHKHFVSWAFIRAWGKEIRNHLEQLQKKLKIKHYKNRTKSSKYNVPRQLIQKSKKILKIKGQEIENIQKKEINKDINYLIKKYQKGSKKEINDIIKLFKQRVQKKND